MKFDHTFRRVDSGAGALCYKSDSINARIDFVSGSCVRVAIYDDDSVLLPTFNINPTSEHYTTGRERLSVQDMPMFTPANDGDTYHMDGGIDLSIDCHNMLLTFRKDGDVLVADRAPLAYNLDGEFGDRKCHYLTREPGERIYGLGDKGGTLNKAGRSFRIDTTDSMGYDAESSDPLYKHLPFYICSNSVGCYGVYYDNAATSYIDLGREHNNYYTHYKLFSTEDNCIVYYIFFGTKIEILQQFCRLCGKQAFPPKWSFDYCASTMAYTDAPDAQEQMYAFLDMVKSTDLSCSGFYLSSGYTSIGDQRCVFHWNRDKFPDPAGFVRDFAAAGIELIPNIKPAFLNTHPMYDMLASKGYFVRNADGTPFVTQFWDGLGSYLDFTNREAFDFWSQQVDDKLLSHGITATWNDNNEFDIRDNGAVATGFGNGEVPAAQIRSVLTYLMVEASYHAQTKRYPHLRPFLSTRSGSIGARRLAQTWSGDNYTSFHDLRFCHNIGLTMSMSGLYFYGHDLGGFSGDMPSRELLLRWIQHGIFEPRFTIHSWNEDGSATMPWCYPDIIDSVRAIFSQRKHLLPYIYNCAYNAVEHEVPINAPLLLYYDDAPDECASFLLGRDVLVTCVLEQDTDRVQAYLPAGDCWYMDDKCYDGGRYVELTIPPTERVPFFVRGGSVVPYDNGAYGFDSEQELVFTVYPIAGGAFDCDYFDDDGIGYGYLSNDCTHLHFHVECDADSVTVRYSNTGNTTLVPRVTLSPADSRPLRVVEE